MLDLAHVVLQVGFCRAIERAAPDTTIAMHVRLVDRTGRLQVDHDYRVARDDEPKGIVEFDSAFGIYRMDVTAPRYHCAATQYLFFIAGHDRTVAVTLADTPQSPPQQPVLLSGEAPQSFLYVQPTFVLFDKASVACNKPIATPLASDIDVENDQDGYYSWLYDQPASGASAPEQLALRLRTPTHQYHYVRVPIPFPIPWAGWPQSIQFNVTEDMVDSLAGDPVDTLLCPKLWRTSAG